MNSTIKMTFPDDYGNFEEKEIAIAYHLAKQERSISITEETFTIVYSQMLLMVFLISLE